MTALAGAGFWACGALELLALFGPSVPDRFFASILAIGVFIVWLPGLAVQARYPRGRRNAGWIVWSTIPPWMRAVGVATFVNAGLLFTVGLVVSPTRGSGPPQDPRLSTAVMSACLMLFYGIAHATLRAGRDGVFKRPPA